jgi:hypothetical protein
MARPRAAENHCPTRLFVCSEHHASVQEVNEGDPPKKALRPS